MPDRPSSLQSFLKILENLTQISKYFQYSEILAYFPQTFKYFQKWYQIIFLKFTKFFHNFLEIHLRFHTFMFLKIFVKFLTKAP